MDKFDKLILFVEKMLGESGIHVHYLKNDADINAKVDMGLRSGILEQENALRDITAFFHSLESKRIYFINDIFQCNYIAFLLPDGSSIFHCGPVLWEPVTYERFQAIFSKLDIPKEFEIPLYDYYKEMPVMPARSFYENIFFQMMNIMYGDDYTHEYISYEDVGNPVLDSSGLFRKPKKTFSYIDILARRYEIENEIIEAVLSGSEAVAVETARKNLQILTSLPQRMPNQLRDYKNYMIAVNTVLRKSIELHEVHPIYIDTTSSQFVIEIENCCNMDQIFELYKKIIITYCRIVRETSHLDHSPFVDTVLTYINADLAGDLSLKSLATHLNVNASYLSALFSDEMGISLTNYVTKCRMQHAQRLLGHSNLTIKAIALQCGFSDIHYFSRQFKKYTGFSPKAYRENDTSFPDQKLISQLKQKKSGAQKKMPKES